MLLADDHPLVLSGLTALLSTEPDLEVVGTCVNGTEVLDFMTKTTADVIVMDLDMPELNGLDVMARLDEEGTLPATIVLAGSVEDWQMMEAERLGAWGVILKEQAPKILLECIHSASDGERWTPPAHASKAPPKLDDDVILTHREADIATQVAQGASNKCIARRLEIAEGTVKVHLHRIYKKLGVSNRVQLALRFRQRR